MKWKSAWFSSIIVSLICSVFEATAFSGGRLYFKQVMWDKVDKMPYKEAKQYLLERSEEISRWQSLQNALQYDEYWQLFILDFLIYVLICMTTIVIYSKFLSRNAV